MVNSEIILIEPVPMEQPLMGLHCVRQRDDVTLPFVFVKTQQYMIPRQQCCPKCPRRAEFARKRKASNQ